MADLQRAQEAKMAEAQNLRAKELALLQIARDAKTAQAREYAAEQATALRLAANTVPPIGNDGIMLSALIKFVSQSTKKSFVIDPRLSPIRVNLIGQDPQKLSFAELLTVLRMNGATAIETNGLI